MASTSESSGGLAIMSPAGLPDTSFLRGFVPRPVLRQVRLVEAEKLKSFVPLRRRVYRPLAPVLREAMAEGLSVRQVAAKLSREASRRPEAALLLCDLYEVLKEVEQALRYYPAEGSRALVAVLSEVVRLSFAGEEVLF